MTQQRPVANDVSPIFTARWSPRAFTGEAIDAARLNTFFEAARWAPSAFNSQPWRFIYARQGGERWADFLGLLVEFNRSWAQHAAALVVVVVSATRFTPPGKSEAIQTGSHAFDTGAAAAYLALQASLAGWHAHAMSGFDKDRARTVLGIPEGFQAEAVIAIGKLGDPQSLPPGLRERETPSPRQALSAIVAEGRFAFPDTPA